MGSNWGGCIARKGCSEVVRSGRGTVEGVTGKGARIGSDGGERGGIGAVGGDGRCLTEVKTGGYGG